MQRKLKDLFRRSGTQGKTAIKPKHAEHNPETPVSLDRKRPPPASRHSEQQSRQTSHLPERGRTESVAFKGGQGFPQKETRNASEHSTQSSADELPLRQRPRPEVSEEWLRERSAAAERPTTHRSPIISPLKASRSPSSAPSQVTSLGGDPELMANASVRKHNEDVADRNIDRFGSPSSRQSSIYDNDKLAMSIGRGSLRTASLGDNSLVGEVLLETDSPGYEEAPTVAQKDPKSWPHLTPRDESHMNWRPHRGSLDSTDDNAPHLEDYGPRVERKAREEMLSSKSVITDGTTDPPMTVAHSSRVGENPSFKGELDLGNSQDVDRTTRFDAGTYLEVPYVCRAWSIRCNMTTVVVKH